MAALLMTMSSRPKWFCAVCTMRATSASSARLVGTASARRPRSSTCRTVSSIVPGSLSGDASVARAAHTTSTPASASAIATARPTPRLAPGDQRDPSRQLHLVVPPGGHLRRRTAGGQISLAASAHQPNSL